MSSPTSRTQIARMPLTERRALVRRLADVEGLSTRAIAARLGVGQTTVRRDLDATASGEPGAPRHTTPEPPHTPAVREPQGEPPTPPAVTRSEPRAPRLIHDLPPWLTQDLNVLLTGGLPEPLARAIHTAAEQRRTAWRTAEPSR